MSENDETVAVPKQQYDEMVEKLAGTTQSNANLVAEIKELREKKQISDAEAEELRKKVTERQETTPSGDLSPEKIAELATESAKKVLSERDSETAKQNKEAAFNAFFATHKEFHPENDEGGLKRSSLEKKLSRFNLDGITSQTDFMAVLEDARNLVVGNGEARTEPGRDPNPLPPNGGGGSAPVKEAQDTQLTSKEMQIIERSFDGDKERYLKIKAKRPDYVATLLQYSV